jgi:rRNA maturation endonuclease Nob1
MPRDFVTLMTFLNVADAEVKRLLLEEEGIKTYLTDAEIVSMDWLLGNAVGSIKLQVATADAERAVDILKNAPPSTPASPGKDNQCLACGAMMTEDEDVCPKCGWTYE